MRPVTTLKPFALLADALTSAGVAVLRYDDRGVGGSTRRLRGRHDRGPGRRRRGRARRTCAVGPTSTPHASGCSATARAACTRRKLAAPIPTSPSWSALAAPAVGRGERHRRAERGHPAIAGRLRRADRGRPRRARRHPCRPARDGDEAGLEASLRGYFGELWDESTADDRTILGDREAFIDRQVRRACMAALPVRLVPLDSWPTTRLPTGSGRGAGPGALRRPRTCRS